MDNPAIERALRTAFGTSEIEESRELTQTPKADQIFRMVVKGEPYLVRVVRRGLSVIADHFACLKTASEAGVAPKLQYVDLEDKICITDFVDMKPLAIDEARIGLARLLRKLHAAPTFPSRDHGFNTSCTFLLNQGPALDGLLKYFRGAGGMPASEVDAAYELRAQMERQFANFEPDMVSCHNDLKPENILFDGARVWLVDWEAAFLNDRYSDLAMISNFLVRNETEEAEFLREYFGRDAGTSELARFRFMRRVFHMFFGMAWLMRGAGGKPIDLRAPLPDFNELHRQIWTGEADWRESSVAVAYGRVHWERMKGRP